MVSEKSLVNNKEATLTKSNENREGDFSPSNEQFHAERSPTLVTEAKRCPIGSKPDVDKPKRFESFFSSWVGVCIRLHSREETLPEGSHV